MLNIWKKESRNKPKRQEPWSSYYVRKKEERQGYTSGGRKGDKAKRQEEGRETKLKLGRRTGGKTKSQGEGKASGRETRLQVRKKEGRQGKASG